MKLIKFNELYNILKENIVYVYANNSLSNKIKIQKMNKILTVVDLNKVKLLTVPHYINKDKVFIYNDKMNVYIENFLNIMNQNFDEEDLVNLYDNIIWVMFRRNILKRDPQYDLINNIIIYKDKNDINAIYHELFHLASNIYDGETIIGGFTYVIDDIVIGEGLDEGYTELLAKRYFNTENENTYEIATFITEQLEKIIGQKEMEKCYLNGGLYKLIKNLENFFSLKEIERFICSVDFLNIYDEYSILSDIEIEEFYSQLENIMIFLFKGYYKTLINKNYDDNNLSREINEFVKTLTKGFNYEIDQEFLDILDNILRNLNKNIKLDIEIKNDNKNVL